MKYPTRIYYTEKDKALMWDRWQKGESLHSIAKHFGRSHSSIQGVLGRTGGHRRYRAHTADEAAWDRAKRPKHCKLALNRPLARTVARLLRQRWSPWQIAGRLKR